VPSATETRDIKALAPLQWATPAGGNIAKGVATANRG